MKRKAIALPKIIITASAALIFSSPLALHASAEDAPSTKIRGQKSNRDYLARTPKCPSDNFSDFLKIYSGEQGKNIRQRYTALPLQYEIPGYLVHENKWDSNEPFTVLEIWNPDRDLYFRYKFSEVINDYVDAEDSHSDIANYDRKTNTQCG